MQIISRLIFVIALLLPLSAYAGGKQKLTAQHKAELHNKMYQQDLITLDSILRLYRQDLLDTFHKQGRMAYITFEPQGTLLDSSFANDTLVMIGCNVRMLVADEENLNKIYTTLENSGRIEVLHHVRTEINGGVTIAGFQLATVTLDPLSSSAPPDENTMLSMINELFEKYPKQLAAKPSPNWTRVGYMRAETRLHLVGVNLYLYRREWLIKMRDKYNIYLKNH